MGPREITDNLFQITGADITHPYDSAAYLVDLGEPVLIDGGLGIGFNRMITNINALGYDPSQVKTIILTHCHADHIYGALLYRSRYPVGLVMHEHDAAFVERGDNRMTAAFCFNVVINPTPIDKKLTGQEGSIIFPGGTLSWIHTPGHSPGSISLTLEQNGELILFGQDIAAPLLKEFDCDATAWRQSIQKLISLKADIFCDGHMGPVGPARQVKRYLTSIERSRTEGQ